jgi:hypothetical protein
MTLEMRVGVGHDLSMDTVRPDLEVEHGGDVRPSLRDAFLRVGSQAERVREASLDLVSDLLTEHIRELVGLTVLQGALGHGLTGPTSRPAGFNPVNVAPSPARWMRTTVSKNQRSATSWASTPRARAFIARSKASRTSVSPSTRTYGKTRSTSFAARAARAAVTTGPSRESQCGGMPTSSSIAGPPLRWRSSRSGPMGQGPFSPGGRHLSADVAGDASKRR